MLQGYTPVPIEHFGGLICNWPPEMLAENLLVEAVNLRFTTSEVDSREGLTRAFSTPNQQAITGLVDYVRLDGTELPLVMDATGNLYVERIAGSGNLAIAGAAAPAGSLMNGAAAFNRAYLSFGNNKAGSGTPKSFDGTNLDPVTIAAPGSGMALSNSSSAGNIASGVRYAVVLFQTREGSLTGMSDPVAFSGGGLNSPPPAPQLVIATLGAGASTLPAGTYYFVITWKTASGETTASPEASIIVPTPPSGQSYGINVVWPVVAPTGAVSWGLYASTTAGTETLQSYVAVGASGVDILAPITTGGATPPASGTAGLQLQVTNVPTGPAQVAARVIAFTVAGGTSAGPYFCIGESQTVDGVSETSTVINDNTSTTASFNFDDAFLASSDDVTDQQRVMLLPDLAGVAFSQQTQRLMWWGDPAQPSVVYCSQPSDAGVYFGDTGFFQVAQGSGRRVTAVFELLNQLFAALEDGIYVVTPGSGDPATWGIVQVTPLAGCCGPRAYAVSDGMAFLVHRTGVYSFNGTTATLVSDELSGPDTDTPGVWERINWTYAHLIWAHVDAEQKTLRVGVPLDNSTVCSHVLKVDYKENWDPCIRFSPFTARYHFFPGRRWSIDTIAASQAVRVRRPLAAPALPADRRLMVSQILLGTSYATGAVDYIDPGSDTDNGRVIEWAARTGSISVAETIKQQRQGMEIVGMVQIRARGAGPVVVETVADGGAPVKFMQLDLGGALKGDATGMAMAQGEAVGLRLSNQGQRARLRLLAIYAFCRPTWMARPGVAA